MNITTYKSSDMRRALCLGGLLSILCVPLWADPDIANNVTTPYCDDSVLESDTGPVGIEINWAPNHITLNWYEDSSAATPMTVGTASRSCDYDGTLNVPSAPAARTGYTFRGWRVRCSFASQVCSLTGSAVNELTYDESDSTTYGYEGAYTHDGQGKLNESTYGLSAGEWAVKDTSGGIIKGIASCNSTKPTMWDTVMAAMENETMTEEQYANTLWGTCNTDTFRPSNTFNATASGQGNDQYCWCKISSYTPSGGSACNVASPSWVFSHDDGAASWCAYDCVYACAGGVLESPVFRRALFGVSQ